MQGIDGSYYGTTQGGGLSGLGIVFKMTPSGALTRLISFNGTNGANPINGLVLGSDGNFYGTTSAGGDNNSGTVFKMTPSGTLTTLVSFTSTNRVSNPSLLQGSDGDFYGTTEIGGGGGYSTVFKMTAAGTLTTLTNFTIFYDRSTPLRLMQGSDGNLYGTTYEGGNSNTGMVFKMTPSGALTTLANFNDTNGTYPSAMVQGSDGDFLGTTSGGGSSGYGTVFKVTRSGVLTNLVNFTKINGSYPSNKDKLWLGSDGIFYGTTLYGGSSNNGTVFKMTASGIHTTMANFTYNNGRAPNGIVQGSDGYFYGTTSAGGSSGYGTIFKMTHTGELTTMVNFTSSYPYYGQYPEVNLVQDGDGNFYGTASKGGLNGYGTLFKLAPSGAFTILVHFAYNNGSYPTGALVRGSDGNFYGTTQKGGSMGGGTVFKMTPTGTLTTLIHFTGANGSFPRSDLLQGSDGNFYGTTSEGGSSYYGTVFKITPSGMLTTLVNFAGANGSNPRAGLVRGSDGHLYGTTPDGGTTSDGQPAGGGQIYRLRMGPSVTSQAASNITASSATLNGTVNPGGYETTVSFQYGTDPTLATFTTASAGTLPAGTTDVSVQAAVSALSPGTTYYYRVLASNAENTVPQSGAILSFHQTYSPWAATQFTPAQLADPLVSGPNSDPDKDGIVNLLESAFNTLPRVAGNQVLVSGTGTVGLPNISTLGSGPTTRLRFEYIRRKTGYTYLPMISSGLGSGGWSTTLTETSPPTSIDAVWERVIVEDTAGAGQPKRFGKVMVSSEN